jgi:hypothetical protein
MRVPAAASVPAIPPAPGGRYQAHQGNSQAPHAP